MSAATGKTILSIRLLDPADFPIIFSWMEARWWTYADDFTPRDIDAFIETKRMQDAIHIGVYRDGDLFGMLSAVPVTPIVGDGHAVFRPGTEPFLAAAALRYGARFAFESGFVKVWCRVFEANRTMQALLKRIGAKYEGVILSQAQQQGKQVNMASFALLREHEED